MIRKKKLRTGENGYHNYAYEILIQHGHHIKLVSGTMARVKC